jgi:hypothetical protein
MGYNPADQSVTPRQVLAGWILCLAVIGLSFAATGQDHGMPNANAGDPPYAAATAAHGLYGARIPHHLSPCNAAHADKPGGARGPVSSPTNLCG